jgi:hypothetical protein
LAKSTRFSQLFGLINVGETDDAQSLHATTVMPSDSGAREIWATQVSLCRMLNRDFLAVGKDETEGNTRTPAKYLLNLGCLHGNLSH